MRIIVYSSYVLLVLLLISIQIECLKLPIQVGIIIIDHGSRKNEANLGLIEVRYSISISIL